MANQYKVLEVDSEFVQFIKISMRLPEIEQNFDRIGLYSNKRLNVLTRFLNKFGLQDGL